jgi:hypothetical protein
LIMAALACTVLHGEDDPWSMDGFLLRPRRLLAQSAAADRDKAPAIEARHPDNFGLRGTAVHNRSEKFPTGTPN